MLKPPTFAHIVSRLALSLAAGSALACSGTELTRVILVRHAEKAADGSKDPELSDVGRARAERLAAITHDAEVAALFATQFKRTQATLAPTAKARGLQVTTLDASDTAGLVHRILVDYAGKVVLVAAHSNTIPAIVAALGGPAIPQLADDAYDDLFVVLTDGHASGPGSTEHSALVHLRYDDAQAH